MIRWLSAVVPHGVQRPAPLTLQLQVQSPACAGTVCTLAGPSLASVSLAQKPPTDPSSNFCVVTGEHNEDLFLALSKSGEITH